MRRRPFWITTLCLVALFLVLLGVGYWWDGWPERTREKVVSLLRAEKMGALQPIFEDSEWKVHSDGSATLISGDESVRLKAKGWVTTIASLKLEPRSLSSRIEGSMVGSAAIGSGLGKFEVGGRATVQKHYTLRLVFKRGKVLVSTTAVIQPAAWTTIY